MHRRDDHKVHVSAPAAVLQLRHLSIGQRGTVQDAVRHAALGRYKPNAPVMILSNRYDPLVPWTGANQLGRDWCAQGADVEFWTNEEPPFLNKPSSTTPCRCWSTASGPCSGSPTDSTGCRPRRTAASSEPRGSAGSAAVPDVDERLPDAGQVGLRRGDLPCSPSLLRSTLSRGSAFEARRRSCSRRDE